MNADILVDIHFYSTENGGKKIPIIGEWYGCPLEYEGEYFDCRIITKDRTPINPGDSIKNVPLAFLSPELILPKLNEGDHFTLWENGTKAEGNIKKILKKIVYP